MTATGSQVAYEKKDLAAPGRTPLAHLLHALNQPLTGLQCSLELALAGLRTPEQYIRTLRDGLELTARMRVLVEAIRELAESEPNEAEAMEILSIDKLVRETAEDLRLVAQDRQVEIVLSGTASLPLCVRPKTLPGLMFRFLESALALAEDATVFHIATESQQDQGRIVVTWNERKRLLQYSPFSRPELGLLIASAGWKRVGADWSSQHSESVHTVTIRLPLVSQPNALVSGGTGSN